MEVTDEQRQLAQQARAYGEQMQALTDSNGAKKKVGSTMFTVHIQYRSDARYKANAFNTDCTRVFIAKC